MTVIKLRGGLQLIKTAINKINCQLMCVNLYTSLYFKKYKHKYDCIYYVT